MDRVGYISSLGTRVYNTDFIDNPEEDEVIIETLEEYKDVDDWRFRYLLDDEGKWLVFRRGSEALLEDVLSNPVLFTEWEPDSSAKAFERLGDLREKLRNGYQAWTAGKGRDYAYLESWFVPEKKEIVILDGFFHQRLGDIACESLDMVEEMNRRICGKSLKDILSESLPSVDEVVEEASLRSCVPAGERAKNLAQDKG